MRKKKEVSYAQIKLDKLYQQKAMGAFIRSRSKCLEEGEQNSHYFFSLEKHHSTINNINKLNINGVITEDQQKIADFCSSFYRELYSSKFNLTAAGFS